MAGLRCRADPPRARGPPGWPPTTPRGRRTRRWPARGRFADDPDVRALVIRDAPRGSRLLYADVVGDRTVVVASPADVSGRPGRPRRRVDRCSRERPVGEPDAGAPGPRRPLRGPRRRRPRRRPGRRRRAPRPRDRPSLAAAQYASVVTPSPDGGSVRSFTPLPLTAGVGVELVGRGLGPATLVSAGGYQGVPGRDPRGAPPRPPAGARVGVRRLAPRPRRRAHRHPRGPAQRPGRRREPDHLRWSSTRTSAGRATARGGSSSSTPAPPTTRSSGRSG